MIRIIDANNFARIALETGQNVSDLYFEISNIALVHPTFVVWDGKNSIKKRRDIYPDYKKGRPGLPEDLRAQFDFLQQMVRISPATQLIVPDVEADDVIAALARKCHPDRVEIHSMDKDLAAIPNATLLPKKELPCPPRRLRLYKTLVGDKADNIKGIPGFGPKAWDKLEDHILDQLEIFLREKVVDRGFRELLTKVSTPKVGKWLIDDSNIDLIQRYWKIIGFFPVNDKLLTEYMENGIYNPAAARQIFDEFFLTEDAAA